MFPYRTILLVIFALALRTATPLLAQDADGDGITDDQEQVLGTDPQRPEILVRVIEDGLESEARRKSKAYDPTKDLLSVEFCHVAENRNLWRVNLAEAPRMKETVLHLYVDADAKYQTGRAGQRGAASTGTDYMLSVVKGDAYAGFYHPDGTRTPGPLVSYVVSGNSVLIASDFPLSHVDNAIRYDLYVLCHSMTPPGQSPSMIDSTGKRKLSGLPISVRKKILRPVDYTENYHVSGTFGLDTLHEILQRGSTFQVRHDQLDTEGFEVDNFTQRRFPHLVRKQFQAHAWTRPPRKGAFHVGFMMYDDSSDERVGILIDGKLKGIVIANRNNNRTWLYWLNEKIRFQGKEKVELAACGSNGKHGIINILFLSKAPKPRSIEYKVENTLSRVPVGTKGRVMLSWTTSMPSTTRFEYGKGRELGQVFEKERHHLVHRAELTGLEPATEYFGRGVGKRPDGTSYYGPLVSFRAAPPRSPETIAKARDVPVVVRNPHPFQIRGWPITTGIPFPRGQLRTTDHVRLIFGSREMPLQVRPAARWLDGSLKWIRLSFLADVPAGKSSTYVLRFGRDIRHTAGVETIARKDGARILADTGPCQVEINESGQCLINGRAIRTELQLSGGERFRSIGGKWDLALEENGHLRAVIRMEGNLVAEDGTSSMRVIQRLEAWKGAPFIWIRHTIVNTQAASFTDIDELALTFSARNPAKPIIRTAEGGRLLLDTAHPRCWQRRDQEYLAGLREKESASKGRILGDVQWGDAGGFALALRDFWQNYPKSFALVPGALKVGLCPEFEPGFYDKFPFEKEGHHLYYYLRNGQYRLKSGVSKTHDLMLCFGEPVRREELMRVFQRPLLGTAPIAWYTGSQAFYDVAPRNESRFKLYEEAIDRNLKAYRAARERQHDYGMLNYGDWYGERGANWGNIEYDTQFAFFLEYIRSGNPAALELGQAAEIHNRDVDTVHWGRDPNLVGAVYVHQMGHVGGYYSKSVPGTLGIPRAGYTVSHAWVEGHFAHYFLTGDRRSYETGKAVADFFIYKELGRPYDFTSCRVPGWHLIMNAAAYASTGDPYYLNASRVIVNRVIAAQDKKPWPLPAYQAAGRRPFQNGGWSRMMVPGHCRCEPRHRGNAGFMVAILLSGLKYYWDVTEDPAVKESIIRGAHYLIEETYSDKTRGFRYTSCPKTGYRTGSSPLMAEAIARAYRWTRDPQFKRVLTEAVPASSGGSSYGKSFSMYYRMAPRMLADMAAAGLTLNTKYVPKPLPFRKPDWLKELGRKNAVIGQAENFTAQGGGTVKTREDRQEVWGKMITYWHRDIGHWLEWKVHIPSTGPYRLIFRYATDSAHTRRKLTIDGKVPHLAANDISFPRTGGYGTAPGQWKYMPLRDTAGKEVILSLSKGKHVLRMTNLGDGLAMDFFLLLR